MKPELVMVNRPCRAKIRLSQSNLNIWRLSESMIRERSLGIGKGIVIDAIDWNKVFPYLQRFVIRDGRPENQHIYDAVRLIKAAARYEKMTGNCAIELLEGS